MFSIERLYKDTCINASNISNFHQLLRSLFTQLCLENPRSHIVVLAKPKLQSMPSRSCKVEIAGVIGIWKCLLECQDWSPTMFLFTNCSHYMLWHAISGKTFNVKGGLFAKHIFVKWPQNKTIFWTAKMAFDRHWRLPYSILTPTLWYVFILDYMPLFPETLKQADWQYLYTICMFTFTK